MTSAVNKTFTTNAEMAAFEMSHCNDEFRIFETGRTRVAITSFPGSGNTWTRHLLHMATGYWTGNAKSSEKLKRAGWKAEDIPCIEGKTIAIKTHKWVNYKLCIGCCKLEQAHDASVFFLWDKQRKTAGVPCVVSSLQHPNYVLLIFKPYPMQKNNILNEKLSTPRAITISTMLASKYF